ncbi:chemotaxis protein CheA [Paenibacillus turpanensis]|uniref:chemotaxis protein CheA n=1 Tax=Paenibacillus turpanensis TaxID=2689078 RepID=UPI00140E7944|nr:chemotaxis protein CheA [Paenibacillus turpanensis]
MEMNQYLSMFIDESREHLQAMNDNMLALEAAPEDISIVQTIFRSAHTLKGMSATMGFEDLASLTHEMENVLDLVRNNKLAMDSVIFDCLFKCLDTLESMVEDIIQGGTGKADVSDLVATLKSIVSGDYRKADADSKPSKANAAAAAAEATGGLDEYQMSILEQSISSGHKAYHLVVTINSDCVLKAARAYMVFNGLENNGEIVQSTPTVEDIEQDKFDRSFSVYYISRLEMPELEHLIKSVSEIQSVQINAVDRDYLTKKSEEQKAIRKEEAKNEASEEKAAEVKQAAGNAKPAAANAPVANRTIRVDIEKLDVLMNLFSELLIDRVRLEQLAGELKNRELNDTVEHMSRVSSDLQNIVLKLRMVPVDSVFNRFPRMIRDLAKSLNKKVDLVVTGAETELDRTVIDEIGDPLVHLLRNSADHGVEPIADRIAAGKPETGTVNLRAFHSGNHVFIEIEDDGRGINRQKVLATAVKKGIVTAEQGQKMTDEEVYMLLFASGFSTADKISDISGRGVGLDVVRSKITSLGGNVIVTSKLGEGTKFTIQLPLTLSIITALLVKMGSEKYAIPLSSIVETSTIRRKHLRNMHGTLIMDFRGQVLPVISLSQLFEVPDYSEDDEEETEIVIIRKGEKVAAVMVEEFIGQQEIVLKTLGKYLTNLFAISGATILGDGQVALIVDTNALIK